MNSVCVFVESSAEEPMIIEYQTQQAKLFPLLAATYAYWFIGTKIRNLYSDVQAEIMRGSTESLPEVQLAALLAIYVAFWIVLITWTL